MFREGNVLTTGISPKLEHLFSYKKHKIFRAYQRQSVQTYLTKIIIAKDQKVFKLYKKHIINNILPYLISKKYLNCSSLLSLEHELGQVMIRTQYQKQNEQFQDYNGDEEGNNNQVIVRKEKDSQTIILSKKMIKGVTLRQMILNKDERLNQEFCFDLVTQIVDFLLMGNGVRDMFITTENIIVEDTGFIHFNYFSFVGLQFIKQDKYITKVQFDQLLPYLTPTLMKNKNYVDLQVELRFILINFISAYFKKDIIFSAEYFELEVQVKRDKTLLGVVTKVTESLLPNILSMDQLNKLQTHRNRILNLLTEFLKEKKKIQKQGQVQNRQTEVKQIVNCNWQYILQNLSSYCQKQEHSQLKKIGETNKEQKKDQNSQKIDKKFKIEIKNFVNQININEKKNCIFIASAIHHLIDVFIDILDNVVQHVESKNLKLKNLVRIQKFKVDLLSQRNQLIKRGRYSRSLYIPIKTGMRFSSILKYRNWVMMLQESESANQSSIQAVFNLLKFILDIRQTMTDIGVYLSQDLLMNIIQHKSLKYKTEAKIHVQQVFQFYSFVMRLRESQNLRKWFWQIFFIITNKILLLVKRFYLRATSYHFIQKIKINQQDFSQILQHFREFIPPLPQNIQQTVIEQNLSPVKSSQQISNVE